MTLRQYPKYEDGSIPWAGPLPATWAVQRGKSLLRKLERPVDAGDEVVTCFRDGVVTLRRNRRLRGFTEAVQEIGYQGVRHGDLVVHAMDAFAGAVGVSDSDGKCSPVYAVCAPLGEANVQYTALVVREMAQAGWIQALARGVRERSTDFRFETLGRLPLPVPPRRDQDAIVRFVANFDQDVASFIEHKRRSIALLREQRTAAISDAVTRGLGRQPPMRDSGSQWLGLVPAHWRVSRLKFEVSDVVDCLHATPNYRPDGAYPAIRTADIEPGKVRVESAFRIDEAEFVRWTERLKPREGDVLYSREGGRYGIAAPVPPDTKLCISQRMMLLRPRRDVSSHYLMWQLNCPHVFEQARADNVGSASPHVNIESIKNFVVAMPPSDEQRVIAAHITQLAAECEHVIHVATQQTQLAQEFRRRLVADVVTGKLDVRDAADNLLDLPTAVSWQAAVGAEDIDELPQDDDEAAEAFL